MLINNAGFGSMGDFVKLDLNHELEMIQLNIRALVDLNQRFRPHARSQARHDHQRGLDRGFQAVPYMATQRRKHSCSRSRKHSGKRIVRTVFT